jgi:lipopolysaccharide exporter
MGYTKEALKGISWVVLFRVSTRIISFVRTAIIARLLTPAQFGTFSIAAIILSLAEILTETGINILLVQKKESIDDYINTAWVVSIFRGFLLGILIFASAPIIALFYNTPESQLLLMTISIVPVLRGFINPSVALFVKDLKFNNEFYYRTAIFFIESVVTVFLAYMLKSPMSLVGGLIAGAIFEVGLSFMMVKPHPVFRFEKAKFTEIIQKGKWLTATGIFNYLYHNGDHLVVGKLLGTSALGLYDMAFRISIIPMSEVSDVIIKVTFPVFVKISDDLERMKRAFIRSILLVSIVSICVGAVLVLFSELIIRILLGPQWVAAAPVLQVLAIFGVIRGISISVIAPMYAAQKQEMVTVITFVSLIGMALTIVPFIQMWGLLGAGYSMIFGSVVALPVIGYFIYKLFTDTKSHHVSA